MRTSSHALAPEELMAYLDGELPADRAAGVVSHLQRCTDCQALAADLRDLSQRLMSWEAEIRGEQTPPKIVAELEEHQKQGKATGTVAPSQRRIMPRRWAWAGAFAVVCVIVGLSVRFTTSDRLATFPKSVARSREPRTVTTLSTPGTAADSNGLFHGLGDRAGNSFSVDGEPITEQQSKVQGLVGGSAGGGGGGGDTDAAVGPMIVRTAGLTITTNDFDRARGSVEEILKRHHGYVAEMNVNTPTGSARSFTATLRVPADQLDATLSDLRKLGRVESESQSGQEVTSQYIDLEARLTNARNTLERLTDILGKRTGKLSDVLAVENEIDRVRGEIERMEAERKNLANQVALATINTTVGEDYRAQLQVVPVSTWGQIRNAAVDGYKTMAESVVAVALFLFSYGPALLLWGAILFFPSRFVWRRARATFER
jgi:hypothetical protein